MPWWRRALCLAIGGGLLYATWLIVAAEHDGVRKPGLFLASAVVTGGIGLLLIVSAIKPDTPY